MPHLTPRRAYLYDAWLFPWAVRIIGISILYDAYAPPWPHSAGWVQWLLDWGEVLAITAIATAGDVFRGDWETLRVEGWVLLAIWIVGVAIVKRIPHFYNWPARRFLIKRTAVTVTPDIIAFKGQRFASDGVGPLAVLQDQDLGIETMRDQSRREAGKRPRGKARYFQNAFEVVMPYHGEPVVVVSIYGSKLRADQVAARIMLARQLASQRQAAAAGGDEFGPGPSLPDEEGEAAAETDGSFWRRMGLGGRR